MSSSDRSSQRPVPASDQPSTHGGPSASSAEQALSAEQAARRLGVSLSTLYAYVSRGLIASYSEEGKRKRRYRAEDVEALIARRTDKGGADRVLAGALHWGEPLCESALTLIQDGRLFYRGQDACRLARESSWEEVTALLWGDEDQSSVFLRLEPELRLAGLPVASQEATLMERFRLALPWLALEDPRRYDLRAHGIRSSGARIIHALVAIAAAPGRNEPPVSESAIPARGEGSSAIAASAKLANSAKPPATSAKPAASASLALAERLARSWAPGRRSVLEAALVLCADHELNVSAFTARCVASAGATPYEVVSAGLAALSGHRHGGHCGKVEALFAEAEQVGSRQALLRRMREGAEVPGFAHPLYPHGDPRGRCLMDLIALSPMAADLVEQAADLLAVKPNIDFALVAVARSLGLADGSALALFALGRTAGWIAHALEQTATGQLIRPRARYIGRSAEYS